MGTIIKRIVTAVVVGLVADAATTKIKNGIKNSEKIKNIKNDLKMRNNGIIDVEFKEVN